MVQSMSKHLQVKLNLTYEEQMGAIGRRVSLESSHLAGFAKTVGEVVPNMVKMTVGFLKGQTFAPVTDYPELGASAKFMRMIESKDYMAINPTQIQVPEGFDGDLAEYSSLLKQSAVHASQVVSRVLQPYNEFLSGLLSTPTSQVSTYDALAYMKRLNKDREKLLEEIGKQFRANIRTSEMPMGRVIRRNRDWSDMLMNLRDAEQHINSVTNQEVKKATDGCIDLLDAVRGMAGSKQLDNVSAEVIQALTMHTLSTAKEVEFYALTSHRIAVLKNATANNIKKLEKLFG